MIVGFNFSKINVERKGKIKGQIRVKNNVDIMDVRGETLPLKDKKKVASVSFMFGVSYEPGIGEILINGNVLYLDKEKVIDETLRLWKEEKKLLKEASVEVLNVVMVRCNVKALELSDELGLPPHMQMPKVNFEKAKVSDYIG